MAAKVEIVYEAEAGSLKATINEINKANDAVVEGAQQSSKEIQSAYKNVGKSIASAFSGSEVKKALNDQNKAFDDLNKKSKPLTQVLRGIRNELNALEESGQGGTAAFRQLTLEAARLEDQIGDTRARVSNLASDTLKFDAGVQAVQGLAAGFEVAQGAAALFGSESEDLQKAILKVQGAMAIANGVQQISNLLLEESKLKTQALTFATKVYDGVVQLSSKSLGGLRVALAATGVGALIVGIGLLITYFDDLMDAIKGTSDTSRSLGNALNESKTAIAGAVEETQKVGNAFELARQGVISKEEALLTYNETLGDSFGRTTDLNTAEENFVKKSAAYVKAAQLRATAQALTAEGAALAAEAALATESDQRSVLEKLEAFSNRANALAVDIFTLGQLDVTEKAQKINNELGKKAQDRVKNEKQAEADRIFAVANGLTKQAELLENQAGIASEAEQKVNEARAAKRKEGTDKAAEAAKKAEEDAKKARERLAQIENEAFVTQLTEQQKIRAETNEKILELEKTFTEARFKAGTVEALRAEKEKNDAIDQLISDRDKRIKELDKKALEESVAKQIEATKAAANATTEEQILALQTQRDIELANAEALGKDKIEITTRYNTQIADLNKQLAQSEYNTRVDNLKALELIEGSTLERRLELINIEADRRKKEAEQSIKDEKERAAAIALINAETEAAIRAEREKTALETINSVEQYSKEVLSITNQLIDLSKQQSENRIADIEATKNAELLAIDQSTASDFEKQSKRVAAEKQANFEIAREKIRQAKLDKAAALLDVLVNTSAAVAKSIAESPLTFGLPWAAFAAVQGGIQAALIASRPLPKYAQGGLVGGRLHSGGGTLIEAERDEYIINRKQSIKHRGELDAINRSSAAFKKLIDERYVRPALLAYASDPKNKAVIVNASLNSKSMEREIKGLRKDMRNKQTTINIKATDTRYLWQ